MKHRLPKPKVIPKTEAPPDAVQPELPVDANGTPAHSEVHSTVEVVGESKTAPAKPTSPPILPQPVASPASGEAAYLIQTRGLVKQYGGRRVVNGVDIHVRAGEVVGLLGKNGAGKTTTFYMIVGLVTPNEGHVYMGEEDVTQMPMYRRARRGIGHLPQEESIFLKLTVE